MNTESNEAAKVDAGGPAFPTDVGGGSDSDGYQIGHNTWHCYGLTVRDYFAIRALAGMFASESHGGGLMKSGSGSDDFMERNADLAYEWADAMLRARAAK